MILGREAVSTAASRPFRFGRSADGDRPAMIPIVAGEQPRSWQIHPPSRAIPKA